MSVEEYYFGDEKKDKRSSRRWKNKTFTTMCIANLPKLLKTALSGLLVNLTIPLNITKMTDLKYFKIDEFDSPDAVGSGSKMDMKFLKKLDEARHKVDGEMVFKINSGYRTQEHNLYVGGRYGSSHNDGLEADIEFHGSRDRYLLLNALMSVGINRIGIGNTFMHADLDVTKDDNVIWTYKH